LSKPIFSFGHQEFGFVPIGVNSPPKTRRNIYLLVEGDTTTATVKVRAEIRQFTTTDLFAA
jgi:hypothetical protein